MTDILSFLFPHSDLAQRYGQEKTVVAHRMVYEYRGGIDQPQILYIQKGLFQVEVLRHRRWHVLDLVMKDQFLGVECFTDNEQTLKSVHYRVRSITDGQLFYIQKQYFLDHLYANPKVFFPVLEQMSQHLLQRHYTHYRDSARIIQDVRTYFSEIIQAEHFPEKSGYLILPREITAKVIAVHLHTSEKQVHEAIHALKAEDWITQKYCSFLIRMEDCTVRKGNVSLHG
ncbi:hypothetical protein ACSMFR_13245 [Listeria aquatica]|uniref:hypothetical protein n=1 Tax=Listeria aquatica TaxID=1494960 RepID=UPI003F6E50EB